MKVWQIQIQGVVQSVGFRPFVKRLGDELKLAGSIRNTGDAGVEIQVQATEEQVKKFIQLIQERKPELAMITKIAWRESSSEGMNKTFGFHILQSKKQRTNGKSVSVLPPDISICHNCLEDMKREGSRKNYPFTSCTDCGPRYTTIETLPYDRERTSFREFPLCDSCYQEYTTPQDRRYHAQTTCCVNCGPTYSFYVRTSEKWEKEYVNWKRIARELHEKHILALMGLGGTHYVLNAFNQEFVLEFRRIRRKQTNKPFAVMMDSIETVRKYCNITIEDERVLLSKRRPIVILPLKNPENWQAVSPGLDTIGVMLPYTGVHYLLFWHGAPNVLIMTSANPPGVPMPITESSVLTVTRTIADRALTHNRRIVQRVDDSVIRSHGNRHVIIRRSRGYVPQPIYYENTREIPTILSLGAEEANTATIMKNGWFIVTQHLGNITNTETLDFEEQSIKHLLNLFHVNPELIIIDKHPSFHTRLLAEKLSKNTKQETRIIEVQHHVAHAASLALEHSIREEPILVWTCDGFGYGEDGNAWGGELIYLEEHKWKRISSLLPLLYKGGDRNAKYPLRTLLYYSLKLQRTQDIMHLLKQPVSEYLPYGNKELQVILNTSPQNSRTQTTALARLLDSIAILLDAARIRTYRGEPAIRLEGMARKTRNKLDTPPQAFIKTIQGTMYFDNYSLINRTIDLVMKGHAKAKIARWVHESVGMTLGEIASQVAQEIGIKKIGFSGGVAYNELITVAFENTLKEQQLSFLPPQLIPPGDGGISLGQAFYAMKVIENE